jgi:adenine-specific DNA methylase
VDQICQAVDEIIPVGSPVGDLFAGSGVVSHAFASRHPVVAADIQEYSRVLLSAILSRERLTDDHITIFRTKRDLSQKEALLADILHDLEAYESFVAQAALLGDWEPLADFLENGSLPTGEANLSGSTRPDLSRILSQAASDLVRHRLNHSSESTVVRQFGGRYFAYKQARVLQGLLRFAHSEGGSLKDTWLAAALSTASDIVNTIGKQFAQPIAFRRKDGEPKLHLIRQIIRDRSVDVRESYVAWLERYRDLPVESWAHRVTRGDYRDVLRSQMAGVECVYADPPYTRDHYSRYYHVLETMCLGDSPEVSTMVEGGRRLPSRGSYRVDRHQSPFSIKSAAPGAFDELFRLSRGLDLPLVISYSPFVPDRGDRPRLLSVEMLTAIARQHYPVVRVRQFDGIAHSKLNESARNSGKHYDAEVLLTCLPK